MRSNTSLQGRVLLWIALQARHLNENLVTLHGKYK